MLTGVPVDVTENVAPYTFRVTVDESANVVHNHPAATRRLREIKPSHLSFRYESIATAAHAATRYHAGAMSELIEERFTDV